VLGRHFRRCCWRRPLRSERGQSLVEIALLMPMLVILLTGALDLGRAYFAYVDLVGAAEYGALFAANHAEKSQADIQAIVAAAEPASGLGVRASDVSLSFPEGKASGKPVQVEVRYRFAALTPFVNELFHGQGITLRASASQVVQ